MRRVLASAAAFLAVVSAWANAAAETAVRPAEAMQHVGEAVAVEGMLDSVVCSAQVCLLSFEPGFSGLVAAIPGDAVQAFGNPEARFEGHRVRLHGTIVERAGRPRLELRDPRQVDVLDAGGASGGGGAAEGAELAGARSAAGVAPSPGGAGERSRSGAAADRQASNPAAAAAGGAGAVSASLPAGSAAAVAPGEVRVEVADAPRPDRTLSAQEAAARLGLAVDRAGAPRDRAPVEVTSDDEVRMLRAELTELRAQVASLQDALGEMQDRLASVEQATDENALAQRDRQAAPAPYIARSGVDPSTLRRVGRGWSAKNVLRFLGEPLQVTGSPPGPYTWVYEGNRMLTIDGNGRVVSSVGF